MEKKLLSILFLASLFFLNPVDGFGQCTASVSIGSNASNNTICAGDSVIFTATPTNGGSNPLYQWRVNGENKGSNSSVNTFTTNTLQNGQVVSVVLTSDITNCGAANPVVSTNSIATTVNPKPSVTTSNSATTCSGAGPNISLTASSPSSFSWIVGNITGGITGASAGSGATINQTLTNPSNSATGTVQYIITPTATAGNCEGTPFTITVTVNPKPSVATASTATICSGAGPNISLTASSPSSFFWTVGTITGGITGASNGSGATINQTLTNPSNSIVGTVQYIVTPTATAGSCEGEPYTITVTVNPKPSVTTPNTAIICSGAGPNISLAASTPSYFSWTVGSITGGITGASAGNGSTINQTLNNPSSSAVGTVQYIVTPTATAGSCAGTPYTITVTVNPKPTITTANTATVCSGAGPNISLTASTPSSFSWTVGTITGGITGASNGTGATINQTLTNPSSAAVGTVQYIITPTATAGSCEGIPYSINVTVNPKPVITTANTATVCSGAGTNISLTAATPSSFSWTVGTITGNITGASAGSGSAINQTLTNPSSSAAGTVQYIVTPTATTGGCEGPSQTITVTVNPKPTVTTANTAIVCSGFGPNISLNASTPSAFSWTIGTITGGITGASAASGTSINQTLTNPSNSAAGTVQYIVTPTATAGSCAGTPYTITVTVNPTLVPSVSITSTSTTICTTAPSGSTPVTFTATPVNPGTNPVFQWKNGTTNVGTNSPIYTASSLADGSEISVVMTSNATCAAPQTVTSSNSITMKGYTPPVIPVFSPTTENVNLSSGVCPPASGLVYTVNPDSNVSTYIWELPTGWAITGGAGTNSITVDVTGAAESGGDFNVIVRANNACGTSANRTFSVNVNKSASVNAGPDFSICRGGSHTLSGVASGYANKYSWSASITGGNFSDNTSLNPIYTPPANFTGTITLSLITTQTKGNPTCPIVADEMILTVNAPPAITAQPSTTTQTFCLNAEATPLMVTATGAGLTYQWFRNTNNSNSGGTQIAGATNSTYTPVTTSAGTSYYYVTVSGTCTPPITSNISGAVTIYEAPAITAQPSTTAQNLCLNAAATQLSVTATGEGLTYQWYSNSTNSNTGGTSLGASATSSTYTPVTTTSGILYYYVLVSGTCTPPVTSDVSGAVSVYEAPAITAHPSTSAQNLCLNADAAQLSVTATGEGLTYQWYSNTTSSNSGGTLISGATSSSFTPITTTAGTQYYYVIVSGTCTPMVTSNVSGAVTVYEAPTITAQPSTTAQNLCLNAAATQLSVTATGEGLTYQWYSNTTNSNTGGTSLGSGATSSTYTPVTTTAGTLYYYAIVSGTCTPPFTSDASGAVTVYEAPAITTQPSTTEQTLCLNADATQLSVTATGEGLTYQWYSNTTSSNSGGTSLGVSATSSTYRPVTTTSGTLYYYVIVSGTCTPPETSDVSGAVTVYEAPAITAHPSTTAQNLCLSDAATQLSVTATGEGLTYQWYSNTTNSNTGGTSLGSGATSSTYTPLSTTAGTLYYYAIVSGTCTPPVTSDVSGAIIVNEPVAITKDLDNSETYAVCAGFPIEFSVEATGTGLTYEWTRDGQPVGTNSPTYKINQAAASDTGKYKVLVKGTTPCSDVLSNEIDLIVNQSLTITSQPEPTIPVCLGENSISLSVVVSGDVYDYVWRKNGIPISDGDGAKYSGTATANLTIKDLVLTDSHTYDVIISSPEGSCSQIISTPSVVTVYDPPTVDAGPDVEACSTETSIALSGATAENHTSLIWTTTGGGQINNATDLATATYSPVAADFGKTLEFTVTAILTVGEDQLCADAVDTREITIIPQPLITELSYVSENTATSGAFCETDDTDYTPHFAGDNLLNGEGIFTVEHSGNPAIPLVINSETGVFNPNGTTPGTYVITYTYTAGSENETCTVATKEFSVNITEQPVATFSYENTPFCSDAGNPLPAMGTDAVKGIFSSAAGLVFVDDETGEINIEGSTPGTYTVTNTIAAANGCAIVTATSEITINQKPEAPEVADVAYCLNEENVPALTATADSGATLNWYNSPDATTALETAPQPHTSVAETTSFWVSQTSAAGCESERVQITITINALPEVSITVDESVPMSDAGNPVICFGSNIVLTGDGATEYTWSTETAQLGTSPTISVSPEVTTTYYVTGTDYNECTNTAEIIIEIDPATDPGELDAPASVCIDNPAGDLELSDYVGEIVQWHFRGEGDSDWSILNDGNTNAIQNFSQLTKTTTFRATVKSGVCGVETIETTVTIDPTPEGGSIAFEDLIDVDNDGTYFMICEGATSGYLPITLPLSDVVGTIVAWKYRSATGTWQTVGGDENPFTGNVLSGTQIKDLNLSETTVFRVEIASGACVPNAFSETAILGVIPSHIEATPVTVDKDVICIGDSVNLSSLTTYTNSTPTINDGTFDNAGIKNNGWRFLLNGQPSNFNTSANNLDDSYWARATPHDFNTAAYNNSPNYPVTRQRWAPGNEEGNKGFAIVSGPQNNATMETNTFSIGSMDQAIITFDQAYNLTPGATITVEISKDGGANYEKVLYTRTGSASSGNYANFGTVTNSENKIVLDLGEYLGEDNLRIRFSYTGTRTGNIWAIDAIEVPQGPRNINIEWNDYSIPGTVIPIGTTNSVNYEPKNIGLNVFEVKAKLFFDSTGNTCGDVESSETISVFVFDTYTTSTTATLGICGSNTAQLSATIKNAAGTTFTTFPTPDGYVGEWKIEGGTGFTLIDSDPNDGIDAINDPKALLTVISDGSYKVSFILKATTENADGVLYENLDCKPTALTYDVVFRGCTTLDFDGFDDYVDLGLGTYAGSNSVEAWIYPEGPSGTIISLPNFELNMNNLPPSVIPGTRWYHISVTGGELFVDGIKIGSAGTGNGGARSLIGAKWNESLKKSENHFSGWIEEVRIWNKTLTQEQIRFMMNQRLISNGAQMGEQIPMDVPGGLTYANLEGYYRLISAEPEPLAASPVEYLDEDKPANGLTPDRATTKSHGRLINMESNQENTAPLPYYSVNNGIWETDATWLRPDVWDPPHTGSIEWNIVRTSNDITSGSRNIKVLGLISEKGTLDIYNPSGSHNETNSGQSLWVTHYLLLNGIIDLTGESQLLQDVGSIVESTVNPEHRDVTGYLERDQQGTANSYNYNYWSFPVSAGASNAGGSIKALLKDGSDSNNPGDIFYDIAHTYADNYDYVTGPKRISSFWLFKFHGLANEYGEWARVGEANLLKAGEGFTMKGTSGAVPIATRQNYVFRGLPNNGQLSGISIGSNQNRLIGNPYPSALDAVKFIKDNLNISGGTNTKNVFNGALYFWDHFGPENTHVLREYVGGYATINLSGAVASATSSDERINNDGTTSSKIPGQFVPVGQGFFINTALDPEVAPGITIEGGDVVFNNNQRAFVTEADPDESYFLKPEYPSKDKNSDATKDNRLKIRLDFTSPLGYMRQILVTADANTTNGFDLGYDAPLIDNIPEDMFWLIQNVKFVIQGVPNFNTDQVLPLGFKIKETGNIKIEIGGLENFPASHPIYLHDKQNDSIHDLRKLAYSSTSEPGIINDRFEIIFSKDEEVIPPVKPVPGEIDYGIILRVRHSYSSRELQILNPDEIEISNLYLFDLNGNLLEDYDQISNEKEIRLPVRGYSSGVYILKLFAKDKVISKKIIISN